MKIYGLLFVAVFIGSQLVGQSLLAQDAPAAPATAEDIRALRQKIEELEQKVKALEGQRKREADEKEIKSQQHIEELDQKVKVLERNRELDQEAAVAKAKSTPKISMNEAGFAGFGIGTPDKGYSLKLRGYVQTD